jgi:hypothetical protein
VWKTGSIGNPNSLGSYSVDQLVEVTGHEFGHASDFSFKTGPAPNGLPSNQEPFKGYLTRDTFDLNMVQKVNGDFTRRHPCKPTELQEQGEPIVLSTTTPPFKDVTDLRKNIPICNADGTVKDAIQEPGSDPWNQDTVNAQRILEVIEPFYWIQRPEIHAQTFTWKLGGNRGARPMIDQLFDKGYLPCLQGYVQHELTTGTLPTAPLCTAPLNR